MKVMSSGLMAGRAHVSGSMAAVSIPIEAQLKSRSIRAMASADSVHDFLCRQEECGPTSSRRRCPQSSAERAKPLTVRAD